MFSLYKIGAKIKMATSIDQKINFGNNVYKISADEAISIYKMKDETGEGMMTCFHVLPGIDLMYNDFHMQSCLSCVNAKADMICIDHCREGRIEWELSKGSYLYMQEGDLRITDKKLHNGKFSFPLSHYHGITICIYINEARKTLEKILGGIPVDLSDFKTKFCSADKPFIMRESDSVHRIFYDLYNIPDKTRIPYFKIKVLELIMFLSEAKLPRGGKEHPYFSKTHVKNTKEMVNFLVENVESHYTLNELSEKFCIPLTSMKNCFKGIYGTSIYSYLRVYRMQTAAYMLRKTSQSITTIAANVGYSNPSKFSAAFKKVMGMPPMEYRKRLV